MKTIYIYTREVLVRTGFRKYPYKQVVEYQISVGKELKDINNKKRVPFVLSLKTRSNKKLNEYLAKLGNQSNFAKDIKQYVAKLKLE